MHRHTTPSYLQLSQEHFSWHCFSRSHEPVKYHLLNISESISWPFIFLGPNIQKILLLIHALELLFLQPEVLNVEPTMSPFRPLAFIVVKLQLHHHLGGVGEEERVLVPFFRDRDRLPSWRDSQMMLYWSSCNIIAMRCILNFSLRL